MAGRNSIRAPLSTASVWAVAQNNDLAQLKDLMAKGVGIAARDEEGATIVHHAASSGAMDIVTFVCSLRRADFLNIQDKHGQTAVFRAVSSNQPKAALFLVESGADPNVKSKNGLTAITRAEAILGATYAQALQVAWETVGRAKNPEAAAAAAAAGAPAADGSPMSKADAKGLFQNKADFRNPEEERRRKDQMAVDNEVDLYLRGNDTRELTKRLALTANPRVQLAVLPERALNTAAEEEFEVAPQQMMAVPVSADNYIDLDDLGDAVSEFTYIALCITMNLNPESAAAITPKLNEALKSLAEQVKRVFHALQTYAQPFVLNQRNKIIAKAKGVQDSLKYCLESTKAVNASQSKETNQRLLNTTQLLVSDYCGFFFSCEQVYPETVIEQVHFSESNIGTLLQLLDKRAAARPQQVKSLAAEIRQTVKLVIGDTVRLNALVTARAFDKRDYEYQKQLSDSCFFITRAVKGINLLTEKIAGGDPSPELREKVNTLTTALSEQLSKIVAILHEPLRELPPPVFDEAELQEMASRYQMAFKELNDAYLRYVESFQHWQETRTPPRAPADPEAPIPPDFAFTERRESVTLVKVILSNIGLIKEIFARPGPLELMKTTRSLAQSLSKFCANSFRVAADCNDPSLRELLMVSLQSTLLHNCHLKMITASKAMGYPLFLIEPSMLATVRSLASILVVLLDASIEADHILQGENVNPSSEQLAHPKLKILSFGRIVCAPLPKAAPQNSKLEPAYSDPGPQNPEPAPGPDVSAGAAALNAASATVQLPVSPLSNAVPAAAMARKDNPPKGQSKSERRVEEDAQPTAPSAGPGSLRRGPQVDSKGKIVPEMAVGAAAKEELGPPPSTSDQDAYKAYMIKKYELQQRENAEILRRKKEAQP